MTNLCQNILGYEVASDTVVSNFVTITSTTRKLSDPIDPRQVAPNAGANAWVRPGEELGLDDRERDVGRYSPTHMLDSEPLQKSDQTFTAEHFRSRRS